jgi:hypothetical protein
MQNPDSIREEKANRLKSARIKAGYDSAQSAAEGFGWTVSAYRHHENGTRGFGADVAKKYGRAFKVKPGWLLALPDIDDAAPAEKPDAERLVVSTSVAAGVWRESGYWDKERQYALGRQPLPYSWSRANRLGSRGIFHGRVLCPGHGSRLHHRFQQADPPVSGDHVIVERTRKDGLRELTVKEYLVEDGHHFLVPRSTKPEFQQRIEIGRPDKDFVGDEGVRVIAFVVGAIPPQSLAILRRMGAVKPVL